MFASYGGFRTKILHSKMYGVCITHGNVVDEKAFMGFKCSLSQNKNQRRKTSLVFFVLC